MNKKVQKKIIWLLSGMMKLHSNKKKRITMNYYCALEDLIRDNDKIKKEENENQSLVE